MPSKGSAGDLADGYTWTGPVDDGGRPDGHGVLAYPAGYSCEYEEGTMAAGLQQGGWVRKYRAGKWASFQYKDDAYQSFKARPAPPRPPEGGARAWGRRGAGGGRIFTPPARSGRFLRF